VSGVFLAVSTYQAGKIILIREDKGTINTHFHTFNKPMGIAADGQRLTVGGRNTVWYYRNMPALSGKLEPPGRHDACYLPRRTHFTGDIDIHEMAWGTEGLWLVNTKFCCLCTLDPDHSFTPCWRPHFISQLSPEDRCHLNGMAMKNGVPAYVTALGETDTAGEWRKNKRDGGILMSVRDNRVLTRGLSMPHSPRLYQKRLWFLESGKGGFGWFDPATLHLTRPAQVEHKVVAKLPGFTRGLDFVGPLAFIGLSLVRESAVFSGIPLVEQLNAEERSCGIWVVDIRTGETVAFLRFDSGVEEIFAVQVLPARFPEILESSHERMNDSYVVPDEALRDVPASLRNE
ncbi:MAG: TIGR03032 family protein, partial [Candidatus Electrothrix sp. AR3]|nr:TIGR03032 family protein [Candidatus Electrothrix sp. AR3]